MAELLIKEEDKILRQKVIDKQIFLIGRSDECDVLLNDFRVNQQHARILFQDKKFYVENLDSVSGTFVNGEKAIKTILNNKDVIAIGKHRIIFMDKKLEKKEQGKNFLLFKRDITMKNSMQNSIPYLIERKGKNPGKKYSLSKVFTTIGKGKNNTVFLKDIFISRIHAHIEKKGERYYLRDEGTWRGTYVNNESITEISLMNGDIIRLGNTELEFLLKKDEPEQEQKDSPPFTEEEKLQHLEDYDKEELSLLDSTPSDVDKSLVETPVEDTQAGKELSGKSFKDKNEVSPKDIKPSPVKEKEQKSKIEFSTTFKDLENRIDLNNPEIKKWYNGLYSNKPTLKKYAAKQLKKLTGIDVDPDLLD